MPIRIPADLPAAKTLREENIFVMEHERALKQDILPANYYPEDDVTRTPVCRWRSGANLLFSNWLNYFVYQSTPYSLTHISLNERGI